MITVSMGVVLPNSRHPLSAVDLTIWSSEINLRHMNGSTAHKAAARISWEGLHQAGKGAPGPDDHGSTVMGRAASGQDHLNPGHRFAGLARTRHRELSSWRLCTFTTGLTAVAHPSGRASPYGRPC